MTKEALSKLNEKQMRYCTVLSSLINHAKEKGAESIADKQRGKLRGYLECLRDMEVITHNEMQSLYLWFFTADRS